MYVYCMFVTGELRARRQRSAGVTWWLRLGGQLYWGPFCINLFISCKNSTSLKALLIGRGGPVLCVVIGYQNLYCDWLTILAEFCWGVGLLVCIAFNLLCSLDVVKMSMWMLFATRRPRAELPMCDYPKLWPESINYTLNYCLNEKNNTV